MRLYWKRKVKDAAYLMSLLLIFCGVVYPLAANYLYERRQDTIITTYEEGVLTSSGEVIQKEKEVCRLYNEALRQSSVVMTGTRPEDDAAVAMKQEYEKRLNLSGNGVMGYLKIPKIGLELPIFHEATDEVLANALGHLPETSLPVGGSSTHAAITGHSGVSDKRLFTDLEELLLGDCFFLHVLGDVLCYQVDRILVVKPEETEWLVVEEGRDDVTLITCTPFGINDHRLLIRGTRVEWSAEKEIKVEEEKTDKTGGLTWYLEYGRAVAGGATIYAVVRVCCMIWRKCERKWGNGSKRGRKVVRSAQGKSRKATGSGDDRG